MSRRSLTLFDVLRRDGLAEENEEDEVAGNLDVESISRWRMLVLGGKNRALDGVCQAGGSWQGPARRNS